jgi:hypothetical protein
MFGGSHRATDHHSSLVSSPCVTESGCLRVGAKFNWLAMTSVRRPVCSHADMLRLTPNRPCIGNSALLHLNVAAAVHCVLSAHTWQAGPSPAYALVAPHVAALLACRYVQHSGWTHQPFPMQSGIEETKPRLEHRTRSRADVEGQERASKQSFLLGTRHDD